MAKDGVLLFLNDAPDIITTLLKSRVARYQAGNSGLCDNGSDDTPEPPLRKRRSGGDSFGSSSSSTVLSNVLTLEPKIEFPTSPDDDELTQSVMDMNRRIVACQILFQRAQERTARLNERKLAIDTFADILSNDSIGARFSDEEISTIERKYKEAILSFVDN
jgi:hypothetical protein